MKEEKLNFGIILRIGISLLPILFGYSLPAVIWCSFNIAMSFIVYGPLTSVVSSLCAVCISMFFCGFYGEGAKLEGLFIALQAIFCAAACIYAVAGRKKFFHGVWLASIGHLIPSFLSVKNAASQLGQSVAQYLTGVPLESVKMQLEAGMNDASVQMYAEELGKSIELIQSAVAVLVPAMLIISSVIVGYLVMWCVSARLRPLPTGISHSFSEIKIPKMMTAVLLLSLVLSFLNLGDISAVAVNVFAVLSCFLFFAGMSLTEFLLRKSIKNAVIRVIVHFAIFISLSAFAGIAYMLIAVIDAFCDFRKIEKRGQCCEAEE